MHFQHGLKWELTRDGKVYKQRYEKGKVMYKLQVIGEAPERYRNKGYIYAG